MKKTSVKILVLIVGVAIVILSVNAILSAKAIARYQTGLSNVTSISVFMENYKGEHGAYPSSLPELASRETDNQAKNKISQILNKCFGEKYEYYSTSNGFSIVTMGYEYRYAATSNGFAVVGKYSTNTVSIR